MMRKKCLFQQLTQQEAFIGKETTENILFFMPLSANLASWCEKNICGLVWLKLIVCGKTHQSKDDKIMFRAKDPPIFIKILPGKL